MKRPMSVFSWLALAGAAAVVVTGVTTMVLAVGAPGKAEVTDEGKSWPWEVMSTTQSGKSMGDLLTAIHDKAVSALATATPDTRTAILSVITRSLACIAYDGNVPVGTPPANPLPAHSAANGPMSSHAGAKTKVEAAYADVYPTAPATPDWAACGGELDHGH